MKQDEYLYGLNDGDITLCSMTFIILKILLDKTVYTV